MQAKAIARFIRVSPQKARLVAEVVKGKSVEAGLNTLLFMPKKSAGIIGKVLRSA
ncbi:MAG: uL22 family ribosomal protein, partial [Thermodesulfobacteriota bacterium]